MSQGVLPYVVEVSAEAQTLTAHAGLLLVLETMRALGMDDSRGATTEREQKDDRTTLRPAERSSEPIAQERTCKPPTSYSSSY